MVAARVRVMSTSPVTGRNAGPTDGSLTAPGFPAGTVLSRLVMPRRLAPLSVVVAAVAMAALTWGTWPDAVYDYGTHLYVPWRITQGQRLYRDMAYFYGPLSEYANAGLFRLFGVGLWTLAYANLAILAGVLAIVYRLAGAGAAIVLVGAFAFGQYVGIGNYNWVCPYCHEVTHGVALGLAAVAATVAHGRSGRRRWLVVAGGAVGLALLTKPEVAAAAVVATVAGVVLCRPGSATRGGLVRRFVWVTSTATVVVAAAFAALATQVGWRTAAHGLTVPWTWVFDSRVSGLAFYRAGMGTDDVPGNLGRMAIAVVATAVPVAGGWLAGRRSAAGWIVAAVGWVALAVWWPYAFELPRAWPALVGGVVVLATARAVSGRVADRRAWAARATLAVFALALLAKMALATRVAQYGFTLAMPAAVVLTDAAVRWGPAAVAARGGDGRRARAVAVAYVGLFVAIHVGVTASNVSRKTVAVGTGRDRFWADGRGAEVTAAVAAVRSADTVATVPQGLMVNYLARRADPLSVLNLMPPELASAGEESVLAELRRRPPAAVVVVAANTAEGGYLLTEGHHVYGRSILGWIEANYRVEQRVPGGLRLTVMRRK